MATQDDKPTGPDLAAGISAASLADGAAVHGHVGEEPVPSPGSATISSRSAASCSHYGGPLAEGLVVGDTVRCPWHHACFSLRTGEALRAPGLRPGRGAGGSSATATRSSSARSCRSPRPAAPRDPATGRHFVIVGGGAAGFAAAERLRREGFEGELTMICGRRRAPDRPAEPLQGLPRRQGPRGLDLPEARRASTSDRGIRLELGATAAADRRRAARQLALADGRSLGFDAAAARHRRRAGPARHPRRRPAARLHPARARRQPRDHRAARRAPAPRW